MWNETQDITEKNRKQRRQVFQSAAMWYLHLQHHDRDNDRDHAVTERLQLPSVIDTHLSPQPRVSSMQPPAELAHLVLPPRM